MLPLPPQNGKLAPHLELTLETFSPTEHESVSYLLSGFGGARCFFVLFIVLYGRYLLRRCIWYYGTGTVRILL